MLDKTTSPITLLSPSAKTSSGSALAGQTDDGTFTLVFETQAESQANTKVVSANTSLESESEFSTITMSARPVNSDGSQLVSTAIMQAINIEISSIDLDDSDMETMPTDAIMGALVDDGVVNQLSSTIHFGQLSADGTFIGTTAQAEFIGQSNLDASTNLVDINQKQTSIPLPSAGIVPEIAVNSLNASSEVSAIANSVSQELHSLAESQSSSGVPQTLELPNNLNELELPLEKATPGFEVSQQSMGVVSNGIKSAVLQAGQVDDTASIITEQPDLMGDHKKIVQSPALTPQVNEIEKSTNSINAKAIDIKQTGELINKPGVMPNPVDVVEQNTQSSLDIEKSVPRLTLNPSQYSQLQNSQGPRLTEQVTVPFSQQPQWQAAVTEKVMWLSSQDIKQAEIHLDPPELGPLHVKVTVNQDQAHVSFSVAHASVREALDQNALRLRESFEQGGLDLIDVDVSDQSQHQQEKNAPKADRYSGHDADSELDEMDSGETKLTISTHIVDAYI